MTTRELQGLGYREQQRLGYGDLVVDTAEDFRVHSRVYKDAQIFEDEMHAVFEKTWVYLCHESEVANPGDYRTSKIGTTSVIITRDQNENINALINTCRHRANAVCRYDYGNAQNFRCPYHGWVYKNSGENIGVADRRRYPSDYTPDYTQENLSLLKVPHVASYRGLIFGCLDKDVPYSLDEYLGELKKYIDRWADRSPEGEFQVKRPHLYSYNGNWKFQAENGNDGYHGGFTHQSTAMTFEHFGPANPNRSFQKVPHGGVAGGWTFGHGRFGGGGRASAPVTAGRGGGGAGGGRGLGALSDERKKIYWDALVNGRGEHRAAQVMDYSSEVNGGHFLIFPNVFLFPHLIRVIHPISPEETEVASYPLWPRGLPDDINSQLFLAEQGGLSTTGMTNTDDIEMFAANQTGLRSTNMEWLVLNRGLGREENPFPGEWWGEVSDETPFRFLYREWKRLMLNYEAGR